MEFKQVQTFITLAETLHFGQAAENLRIAQPHVSRRIKQLEEELDVVLFDRNRRNVRLTEAGAVFLGEARKLMKDADVARERTRQSALGKRGRLNISLIGSAMLGSLPAILDDFRRRYPDVQLTFREMGSTEQLDALDHQIADIAFFHPPIRGVGAYDHVLLEREPLLAVLPAKHALAGKKKIRLAELADDPWVMFPRENSIPIYDRIIALCHRAGFSPNIVQEAGPVPTRLGLVAAGFGVHLVHRAWETMPYPGVVYLPIEPTATVGLSCYWRRGEEQENPMMNLFIEVVKRYKL
jgi:DNA-binding transcriptional LysR family regulator